MASIPILAAVVSAIALPVVGTGIYYSVKPSSQGESIQQNPETTLEAPTRKPQLPKPTTNWGMESHHREHGFTDIGVQSSHLMGGSSSLNTGRFRTPEVSLQPLIDRSTREKNEAIESMNRALKDGNIPELSGLRLPSSVTVREVETHSVSSSSSLTRH